MFYRKVTTKTTQTLTALDNRRIATEDVIQQVYKSLVYKNSIQVMNVIRV